MCMYRCKLNLCMYKEWYRKATNIYVDFRKKKKKDLYVYDWEKNRAKSKPRCGSLTSPPWHPVKFLAENQDHSAAIRLKSPIAKQKLYYSQQLLLKLAFLSLSQPRQTSLLTITALAASLWSFWTFLRCVWLKGKNWNRFTIGREITIARIC